MGPYRRKIKPQESPDDWVEIEKTKFPLHIPRSKYDKIIGHTEPLEVAGGRSFVHDGCGAISHVTWKGYKFVCRRKDLPVMPSPKRTVVLKQWIVWDEVGHEWQEWGASKPIAWKNAFETGVSKTVEVQS